MVVVPAVTLVTIPVTPTVAAEVLVLLHAPPAVASLRVVVTPPAHTVSVPVIPAGVVGKGFTVTVVVAALAPQVLLTV